MRKFMRNLIVYTTVFFVMAIITIKFLMEIIIAIVVVACAYITIRVICSHVKQAFSKVSA